MKQRDEKEYQFDTVAYSILIALNFMHRRYGEIDDLWKEMIDNKVYVTISTLHTVVRGDGQ